MVAGEDLLFGGKGDDILIGGNGDDVLKGNKGNDSLIGVGSDRGQGSFDILIGGSENDTFVLGDSEGAFYSDGDSFTAGTLDYAEIRDFNLADDTIQLTGSADDYVLGASPSGGSGDVGIFLKSDVVGGVDELVAVVRNGNSLSLNDSYFTFV